MRHRPPLAANRLRPAVGEPIAPAATKSNQGDTFTHVLSRLAGIAGTVAEADGTSQNNERRAKEVEPRDCKAEA